MEPVTAHAFGLPVRRLDARLNDHVPAITRKLGEQSAVRQRAGETLLTGDTAAQVRKAALAKVSGATIERVETDADGNAAYEAHMVKSDGTRVTVYVNKSFEVVSVESGP